MPFDEGDYRKRVLTPYRGSKQAVLSTAVREMNADPKCTKPSSFDLPQFYQITAGMSDAQIARQVADVGRALSRCVADYGALKSIGPWLKQLHDALTGRNPGFSTAAFWAAILQEQQQRLQASLADFGTHAADQLRSLGVVTPSVLRALASASGVPASATDKQLEDVVRAGKIRVFPELPEPRLPVPPAAISELSKSTAPTLVAVIFLDDPPTSFSVIDGYNDDKGRALTLAAVRAAKDVTNRRQSTENDALQKVLSALLSGVRSDHDLHEVVYAHVLELGRKASQNHPIATIALRELTKSTHLATDDAARILLKYAGAAPAPTFPDVQVKVRAGELRAARQLFHEVAAASEGSSPQKEAASTALEAAESEVEAHRATAARAVADGDLEAAASALRAAVALCSDDESLTETLRQLPPARPRNLAATPTDDHRHVRLTWEPGFGSTEEVSYQVRRKRGGRPQNSSDGELLSARISDTAFLDQDPVVAEAVHYSVSATRSRDYSPAAIASFTLLPPVSGLEASTDLTSVTLRWSTPPGVSAVRVRETSPSGTRDVAVNAHSGARSTGLATGVTYTYLVTALYPGDGMSPLASEARTITATPRGEARPVTSFTIADRAAPDGAPELEFTWKPIPSYTVEIWRFQVRPTWGFGQRVSEATVRVAGGTRFSGTPVGDAERHEGVRGAAASGLWYYAALTRDQNQLVSGGIQEKGVCPPLKNVNAERFNDELLLSWEWPGDQFDVLVSWVGSDGNGEELVTRSGYWTNGGCRVPLGDGKAEVSLATVAADGETRWTSEASRLVIPARRAPITYSIIFRRAFLGPTTVTLAFTSPVDCRAPIRVVGQPGPVMPRSATQGTLLTAKTLDLAAGRTQELQVTLPQHAGDYWVRAFPAEPDVRLTDPSSSRMKGR